MQPDKQLSKRLFIRAGRGTLPPVLGLSSANRSTLAPSLQRRNPRPTDFTSVRSMLEGDELSKNRARTKGPGPREESRQFRVRAMSKREGRDLITLEDYLLLLESDQEMQEEFCYLNQRDHCYDWQIVHFDERHIDNYLVLSRQGLTHYHRGQVHYQPVRQWLAHKALFLNLRRIPFFSRFRLNKLFKFWKKKTLHALMVVHSEALEGAHFALLSGFQRQLFKVRELVKRISGIKLFQYSLSKECTFTEFQSEAETVRSSALGQVEGIFNQIKKEVLKALGSNYESFVQENRLSVRTGVQLDFANPVIVGDSTAKFMPFTQEATLRTYARKLRNFVKLIDYYLFTAKIGLIQNSVLAVSSAIDEFNRSLAKRHPGSVSWLVIQAQVADLAMTFQPSLSDVEAYFSRLANKMVAHVSKQHRLLLHQLEVKQLLKETATLRLEQIIEVSGTVLYSESFVRAKAQLLASARTALDAASQEALRLTEPVRSLLGSAVLQSSDLGLLSRTVQSILLLKRQVSSLENEVQVGIVLLDFRCLKEECNAVARQRFQQLESRVPRMIQEQACELLKQVEQLTAQVKVFPTELDSFIEYFKRLPEAEQRAESIGEATAEVSEMLRCTEKYEFKGCESAKRQFEQLGRERIVLGKAIDLAKSRQQKQFDGNRRMVERMPEQLLAEVEAFAAQFQESGPLKIRQHSYLSVIEETGRGLDSLLLQRQKLLTYQQEFGLKDQQFGSLLDLQTKFQAVRKVWLLYHQLQEFRLGLAGAGLISYPAQAVNQTLASFEQRLAQSQDGKSAGDLHRHLRQRLDSLLKQHSIFELMRKVAGNKLLQQDFQQVVKGDALWGEQFSFSSLQALGAEAHFEQLMQLQLKARAVLAIESTVSQAQQFIRSHVLRTVAPRPGSKQQVLDLNQSLFGQVEHFAVALQSLLNGKFALPYRTRLQSVLQQLLYINQLLALAQSSIQSYALLDSVFSKVASVQAFNKMGKQFQQVEGLWKKFMRASRDHGLRKWAEDLRVRAVAGLLEQLGSTVQQIEKQVDQYLKQKRQACPRLVAVPRRTLLEECVKEHQGLSPSQPFIAQLFPEYKDFRFSEEDGLVAATLPSEESLRVRTATLRGPLDEVVRTLDQQLKAHFRQAFRTQLSRFSYFQLAQFLLGDSLRQFLPLLNDIGICAQIEEELGDSESLLATAFNLQLLRQELHQNSKGILLNRGEYSLRQSLHLQLTSYSQLATELSNEQCDRDSFVWQKTMRTYLSEDSPFLELMKVRYEYGFEVLQPGFTTPLLGDQQFTALYRSLAKECIRVVSPMAELLLDQLFKKVGRRLVRYSGELASIEHAAANGQLLFIPVDHFLQHTAALCSTLHAIREAIRCFKSKFDTGTCQLQLDSKTTFLLVQLEPAPVPLVMDLVSRPVALAAPPRKLLVRLILNTYFFCHSLPERVLSSLDSLLATVQQFRMAPLSLTVLRELASRMLDKLPSCGEASQAVSSVLGQFLPELACQSFRPTVRLLIQCTFSTAPVAPQLALMKQLLIEQDLEQAGLTGQLQTSLVLPYLREITQCFPQFVSRVLVVGPHLTGRSTLIRMAQSLVGDTAKTLNVQSLTSLPYQSPVLIECCTIKEVDPSLLGSVKIITTDSLLPWQAYLRSEMRGLELNLQPVLKKVFSSWDKSVRQFITTSENSAVKNVARVARSLLQSGPKLSRKSKDKVAVYSVFWGLSNLQPQSRLRLQKILAEHYSPENVKKDLHRYQLRLAQQMEWVPWTQPEEPLNPQLFLGQPALAFLHFRTVLAEHPFILAGPSGLGKRSLLRLKTSRYDSFFELRQNCEKELLSKLTKLSLFVGSRMALGDGSSRLVVFVEDLQLQSQQTQQLVQNVAILRQIQVEGLVYKLNLSTGLSATQLANLNQRKALSFHSFIFSYFWPDDYLGSFAQSIAPSNGFGRLFREGRLAARLSQIYESVSGCGLRQSMLFRTLAQLSTLAKPRLQFIKRTSQLVNICFENKVDQSLLRDKVLDLFKQQYDEQLKGLELNYARIVTPVEELMYFIRDVLPPKEVRVKPGQLQSLLDCASAACPGVRVEMEQGQLVLILGEQVCPLSISQSSAKSTALAYHFRPFVVPPQQNSQQPISQSISQPRLIEIDQRHNAELREIGNPFIAALAQNVVVFKVGKSTLSAFQKLATKLFKMKTRMLQDEEQHAVLGDSVVVAGYGNTNSVLVRGVHCLCRITQDGPQLSAMRAVLFMEEESRYFQSQRKVKLGIKEAQQDFDSGKHDSFLIGLARLEDDIKTASSQRKHWLQSTERLLARLSRLYSYCEKRVGLSLLFLAQSFGEASLRLPGSQQDTVLVLTVLLLMADPRVKGLGLWTLLSEGLGLEQMRPKQSLEELSLSDTQLQLCQKCLAQALSTQPASQHPLAQIIEQQNTVRINSVQARVVIAVLEALRTRNQIIYLLVDQLPGSLPAHPDITSLVLVDEAGRAQMAEFISSHPFRTAVLAQPNPAFLSVNEVDGSFSLAQPEQSLGRFKMQKHIEGPDFGQLLKQLPIQIPKQSAQAMKFSNELAKLHATSMVTWFNKAVKSVKSQFQLLAAANSRHRELLPSPVVQDPFHSSQLRILQCLGKYRSMIKVLAGEHEGQLPDNYYALRLLLLFEALSLAGSSREPLDRVCFSLTRKGEPCLLKLNKLKSCGFQLDPKQLSAKQGQGGQVLGLGLRPVVQDDTCLRVPLRGNQGLLCEVQVIAKGALKGREDKFQLRWAD